jgi:hypothetical protein
MPMANFLSRMAHGVAGIPHRILVAAGWAQMEPAGLGVTPVPTEDLEERETRRREEQAVLRQGADEERPPDPG